MRRRVGKSRLCWGGAVEKEGESALQYTKLGYRLRHRMCLKPNRSQTLWTVPGIGVLECLRLFNIESLRARFQAI